METNDARNQLNHDGEPGIPGELIGVVVGILTTIVLAVLLVVLLIREGF